MCDRCTNLKQAIEKGRRFADSGVDAETADRILAFVETLEAELATLQALPDHKIKPN